MRINKFIALASGLSRRTADAAITAGRVQVNGNPPITGQDITEADTVSLDGKPLQTPDQTQTILFNKPAGYIVSRDGQGSRTIYDLLPVQYSTLKPVGRLDKDSSGLLLLTNDGDLAQRLTHPSYQKTKVYEVTLVQPLQPLHRQMISEMGIQLSDGPSKLYLERMHDGNDKAWLVTMREGRNRQIRRTFVSLGYQIATLHRIMFGDYTLGTLPSGKYRAYRAKNT
jgi:23S rRNA pseudouridine2605 synthase